MSVTTGAKPFHQVELDPRLTDQLRREARERDLPVDRLVRALLRVIVEEHLVGAVLDDDRA